MTVGAAPTGGSGGVETRVAAILVAAIAALAETEPPLLGAALEGLLSDCVPNSRPRGLAPPFGAPGA